MSREILFKGKREDNGEWVEGDLIREQDILGKINTRIYQIKGDGAYQMHEIDPDTVCQYTGLTDMHGNKILENDICAAPDSMRAICKICYGEYDNNSINKHIGFFTAWEKKWSYFRQDLGFWASRIEVIGNIFDNPELMGGAL